MRNMKVLTLLIVSLLAAQAHALGGTPTLEEHEMQWGGETRTYLLYEPENFNGKVLIMLHGGYQSGQKAAGYTEYDVLADEKGFAAVFPDALPCPPSKPLARQWNDGRPESGCGVDDLGFLQALPADVSEHLSAPVSEVFVIGASNGGVMSHTLYCEGAVFDAFGAVIAHLPEEYVCALPLVKPMLHVAGTADTAMPYEGGEAGQGGLVLSADETMAFYADKAGCTGTVVTHPTDIDNDPGQSAERRSYTGCAAPLAHIKIVNGEHRWFANASRYSWEKWFSLH